MLAEMSRLREVSFSRLRLLHFINKLLEIGSFPVAKGLKKQILQKAIDNRQNITMPDCALKPKRVMEMLKALQEAVS